MRKFILLIVVFLVIGSCKQDKEEVDSEYVISQFKKNTKEIEKVGYNVHRIDTFPSGDVWNNKGFAVVEKNEDDKIFGFSFYGKRDDYEKEYLYDNGNGFEINRAAESYRLIYVGGILGSPGGQMVVENIFHLDSIYKNVELIEEENKYLLKYTLEPDTVYDITDRLKTLELRKNDFFPIKVTFKANKLGKNTVTQHTLSDIKINKAGNKSISDYKDLVSSYDVIQPTKAAPNKILNKEFPLIELSNLMDESETVTLETDKLLLIDFWEVWCSPCIKSFPKVEELSKKYQDELRVIGIVSQSKESAKKLLKNKNVSFLNLIGTNNLLEEYSVNSYPRYFIIDKNGIVRKEYHGFSNEIEKDLKLMISQ
ncbi:TlpA family protein disulfide reductase [Autumnicola musiva]|uniref:TlpA disulfide reductase family protein n=1 Tax=Autumnicola musiva TaxID=3075589 RepID=A0ABU3DB82_9FLAO|nr:TlpA disulfide reductase family protein [Zunongwangia sp. F117]MDT0678791.1 TlpA disulfide reductase family protein [Zunongwangia sp. F117]